MTKVVIRVDASKAIGSGHVVRCATLGNELLARGVEVFLAVRSNAGRFGAWLEEQGLRVLRMNESAPLSELEDAQELVDLIGGLGHIEWIVVDHYGLGEIWESRVRNSGRGMFVIDDLANRHHDCDVLLDQNVIDDQEQPYRGLIAPPTVTLVGPRFALLRDGIRKLRSNSRERRPEVRSVLVCFGGTDPHDHTTAAIEAVRPLAAGLDKVTVVVGEAHSAAAAIGAACRALPNSEFLVAPPNLPEIMVNSDLAIGGGGTMTWERACLGVPTIAFGIADNQVRVLERLFRGGFALGVSRMITPNIAIMRELVSVAVANPEMLDGMAGRAQKLVDGAGVHRVCDVLLPTPVRFRRATMNDCELTWKWRNHPSVRSASLDAREISVDVHRGWMESTLSDPLRILLIGELTGQPVGVVRFDLQGGSVLISVYRNPALEGRRIGLIRGAIEWLRSNRPDISRIRAEVTSGNEPSYRAFRAAGFQDNKRELVMELK